MAARTTDYEAALDDITQRGVTAIRDAKAKVEDTVTRATEAGEEAIETARRVRGSVENAILRSIKIRPYTTLAIAGFIGFLYGATRR